MKRFLVKTFHSFLIEKGFGKNADHLNYQKQLKSSM